MHGLTNITDASRVYAQDIQRQKPLTTEEDNALKEACNAVFQDEDSKNHYELVLKIGKKVENQKT